MKKIFNEADFFRFMEINGPKSDKGKSNYLTWLRYVKEMYNPNLENLTREDVDKIFNNLRKTQNSRESYTSNSAIFDIKSALNKYLEYVHSVNQQSGLIDDISSILGEIDTVSKTEIETRLGQGKYRKEVISIWEKCAVTEFDRVELLIASHIKPWRLACGTERLDPFNGLLLCPHLDRLFDRGYISFDGNGLIIISSLLNEKDLKRIGISPSMRLYKIVRECIPYLEYHRRKILIAT